MTSIGHRYNCSRKVISCFLSKYSLVSPIKFINILSDEELNYIITSYKTKNETMTSLADKYNVSRITIQKLLSSQNIESVKMSRTSHRNDTIIITNLNQKYDINKDFFKQINTHEKAYILGYLYADGYILTRSKKVEGFGISLSSVDHDILEKMCIEFKTSIKRIKTRLPKDFYNPYIKKIYTSHEQSRLDISIKEMGNDLIELGCVPNKSLILKYPTIKQVPLEFQNSFILGYFDGDGCISLSNNKYSIQISSTEHFLLGIKNYFNIKNKPIYTKEKNIWSLRFSNVKEIDNFYNICYKNSKIYLKRKYDKFQEFLKSIKKKGYNNFDDKT